MITRKFVMEESYANPLAPHIELVREGKAHHEALSRSGGSEQTFRVELPISALFDARF